MGAYRKPSEVVDNQEMIPSYMSMRGRKLNIGYEENSNSGYELLIAQAEYQRLYYPGPKYALVFVKNRKCAPVVKKNVHRARVIILRRWNT